MEYFNKSAINYVPDICPETGKYGYDKRGAISQINRVRSRYGKKKLLREYECEHCGLWHISHMRFAKQSNTKRLTMR